MKAKNKRPTVDKVLPLANAAYARNGVGCCLHMVLDGGNVHNGHIESCADLAVTREHDDCFDVACLLLEMSRTQRLKLGSKITRNPYRKTHHDRHPQIHRD